MLSQSKQIAMTEKYELLDKHSHILIIMFCICISTTFQITVQSVSIERLHKCWHVRISFFFTFSRRDKAVHKLQYSSRVQSRKHFVIFIK